MSFYQRQCHGCGQPCDAYYCESCTCPQCGMTLFNGICDNCIYGAGMPIICTTCGDIVRGGLCLPCDLREKNLYNYDPNAYSFNNSNYFPQPQYENYLCNLYGNNSHDGYDCQQQFSFVYEQEPSYNQNYDDNYYPHESLSFPCCDYCGGSHETFQCQPDNQNDDFSGSDQIQTPQYPDDNPPSPKIKYDQSTSTYRPIFLNDNEDHHVQNKKSPKNSSEETVVSKTNQEPPQDSNIHQLIKECSIKVPEQQKQKMEDTMLELVKIYQEKKLFCIHDDVNDLIENVVLREKLFSINRLIANIESLKDNPTPVCVFNSSTSILILEESDNSLSLPEFKSFYDHTEETRSDNTTTYANYSLPEYDSFCFEIEPDQEELFGVVMINIPDNSSNDPLLEEVNLFLSDDSIPLEPPDDNFDLEPEVISAVMKDIDEPDEHFNPGEEIFVSTNNEDVYYFPFMFVIRIFLPYLILPEISHLFLSA
nr:hypothetical protein [Tanacetum cinerariifolium]